MKILKHDVWDIWDHGYTICICTNGFIKKDKTAVMGRGLAFDASKKFPKIRQELGEKLDKFSNVPFWFEKYRLITFPTKHVWWESSDLDLIQNSCVLLKNLISSDIKLKIKSELIFLPIPGISNGKLDRKEVIPILEEEFENNKHIVIVEKP